jgi:glycosyltransferase involved in cell wall biosynthesis
VRTNGGCRVAHLTSVHEALDSRIFYRECRSLARAGYDVVIIAPGAAEAVVDGVRIRALPLPKNRAQRVLLTGFAVLRAALRERADVYHLHDPELLACGVLLRLLGKRVVYDAHEDVPKDVAQKRYIPAPLRRPLAAIAAQASRALTRGLDGTVVAVPAIAKEVRGRRVVTVHNYPVLEDLLAIEPRPWAERSRAAIYLGYITESRGLWEMMAAMALLPPSARLTLAGRFDDPALAARASGAPQWSRIDYVGWVEGSALWQLAADAKIGVVTLHPTPTFLDSLPTKLFEYMALGLPVVASDFPQWRSIVEQSGCGVLVDPLDPASIAAAIAGLLEDPERSQAMGQRGRRAVIERFGWDAEARKLIALYADLCASR